MDYSPTPLLRGQRVALRLVREADLARLYETLQDLDSRGDHYPLFVPSEPAFKKEFQETGFWTPQKGTLLMIDSENQVAGRILYYPTVPYLSELEIGYHLFDSAQAGKGLTSEALQLLTHYLFALLPVNRLRLIIHGKNAASLRIAEKCGYLSEGTARGAWFHNGEYHDVMVYARIRGQEESNERA